MSTTVPQDATSGFTHDMATLAAETESLLPYKPEIVETLRAVAAGTAEEGAALEVLLARVPETLRPAVRRRFLYEVDIIAEHRKRAAAQPSTPGSDPVKFDLASAILLMATGTYETIRDLVSRRPDLKTEVKQLGATMLDEGTTPDMKMVEKLQRILLQALEAERAKARDKEG